LNRSALSLLVAGTFIAGCSVRTADYYRASAQEGVIETKGSTCSVPTAIYQFPVNDGAAGFVQAHAGSEFIALSFSLSLKENRTVRLASNDLAIQDTSTRSVARGSISRFQISVSGRDGKPGHVESFDATAELKGLNRNPMRTITSLGQVDTFSTVVRFATPRLESFSLELPTLVADGTPIKIPPVEFGRREQTYVLACLQ
jgi:hypothetical protein